jgi:hypothetical protein
LREKNLKSLKTNLINLPSEWIVFEEKSRVERLCLVRNNTVVTPLTIALFGGPMYLPDSNLITLDDSGSENDEETTTKFVLDDWIYFVLDDELATMIHQLRIKLNALFIKTMCHIDKKCSPNSNECKIIEVISSVLEIEDRLAGFASPSNVGMRPIALPTKNHWRNKNKMHRNDGGHFQNGRSIVQNSQQSQHLHYHQRQPAIYQSAISLLQNQNHSSIVFKKNNGNRVVDNVAVANSNIDVNPNNFERFVADFKGRFMMKPRIRWFVLHSSSREDILRSCDPNYHKWNYSMHALRSFQTIMNVRLNVFRQNNYLYELSN